MKHARGKFIFLAIVSLLVAAGWLYTRGTYRSGRDFTARSLDVIGQSWSLDELVARAHPSLLANGTDKLARTLDDVGRMTGPIKTTSVMDHVVEQSLHARQTAIDRVSVLWRIDGEKNFCYLRTRVVREDHGLWRFDELETP
ncbi:MAG: hypothetical protein JXO22_16380 [Phycisphaerae bacterium]|nr:hypothetical protein [Phycisphaerae bacterium]